MKNEDFVRELGYLGFTMRLKRISDALLQSGRKLYQGLEVDIEPNWYVIFKLLDKHGSLAITEISDKIRLSHPSVITILNKMIKAGYLKASRNPEDQRQRVMELTEKAKQSLPKFERIWEAGEAGVQGILEELNALNFIEKMEDEFFNYGFCERTRDQLKSRSEPETGLELIEFDKAHAKEFATLNYEWLEKYFYVEDYDRELLENPEKYILADGGQILFAKKGEEIVGTVALIVRGKETFELSKMAVTEKYKGLGIGKKLMEAALEYAAKVGMRRVMLDSNRKLTPAITLYRKTGFKEIDVDPSTPYERCNIRMEILLEKPAV